MTEGYPVKAYGVPVKRYVQVMDLKDEPELIERYKQAHSRERFWPEIMAGIREVGILEMDIHLSGNHLVMIVETALDFDWDTAMARLATLPRQAEWEDHVAQFQQCRPGQTSDEKWHMAHRIFQLYESL
jgi:L-rhamnose mutarotase